MLPRDSRPGLPNVGLHDARSACLHNRRVGVGSGQQVGLKNSTYLGTDSRRIRGLVTRQYVGLVHRGPWLVGALVLLVLAASARASDLNDLFASAKHSKDKDLVKETWFKSGLGGASSPSPSETSAPPQDPSSTPELPPTTPSPPEASPPCECTPPCEGGRGEACEGGLVPRGDCPCCLVCPAQEGGPCAPPGEGGVPCDPSGGLVCVAGTCQASAPCTSDQDCGVELACVGGACADPCPLLRPCGGAQAPQGGVCEVRDHVPHCVCPPGTAPHPSRPLCVAGAHPSPHTEPQPVRCVDGDRTVPLGHLVHSGDCRLSCVCVEDPFLPLAGGPVVSNASATRGPVGPDPSALRKTATLVCSPTTCPLGLHVRGSLQLPSCVEVPVPGGDRCCVGVRCGVQGGPAETLAEVQGGPGESLTEVGAGPEGLLKGVAGGGRGKEAGPTPHGANMSSDPQATEDLAAQSTSSRAALNDVRDTGGLSASTVAGSADSSLDPRFEAGNSAQDPTSQGKFKTGEDSLSPTEGGPAQGVPEGSAGVVNASGGVFETLNFVEEAFSEPSLPFVFEDGEGGSQGGVPLVDQGSGGPMANKSSGLAEGVQKFDSVRELRVLGLGSSKEIGNVTDPRGSDDGSEGREGGVTSTGGVGVDELEAGSTSTASTVDGAQTAVERVDEPGFETSTVRVETTVAEVDAPGVETSTTGVEAVTEQVDDPETSGVDVETTTTAQVDGAALETSPVDVDTVTEQVDVEGVATTLRRVDEFEAGVESTTLTPGDPRPDPPLGHDPRPDPPLGHDPRPDPSLGHDLGARPTTPMGPVDPHLHPLEMSTESMTQIDPKDPHTILMDPTEQPIVQVDSTDPQTDKMDPTEPPIVQVDSTDPQTDEMDPTEPPAEEMDPTEPPAEEMDPTDPPVVQIDSENPETNEMDPRDPRTEGADPSERGEGVRQPRRDAPAEPPASPSPRGHGTPWDEPKLIVIATSHDAVTLAWDDFRSGDADDVYVAEYRRVAHGNDTRDASGAASGAWQQQPVQVDLSPPTVSLSGLLPHTEYEVRVRSLAGEHTETVSVATAEGCVYGGAAHPLGPFTRGCEEACTCHGGDFVTCTDRCLVPYFRRGSTAGDPLCSERRIVADECCVLVVCATRGAHGAHDYDQCANIVCGPNAECVSDRLPRSGSRDVTGSPAAAQPHGDVTGSPIGQPHGDVTGSPAAQPHGDVTGSPIGQPHGDVTGSPIGQPHGDVTAIRGAGDVTSPVIGQSDGDVTASRGADPVIGDVTVSEGSAAAIGEGGGDVTDGNSTNEVAGVARRRRDVSPLGQCMCLPGYHGDPTNLETGCNQRVGTAVLCHHHNATYRPGELFYDKCISKCRCTPDGELDCQPRCPPLPPPHTGCEVVDDPHDPCCQTALCPNSTGDARPVRGPSPRSGCVYGNATYERGEAFTDGCAFRCVCLGYGDVSCSPRCSPLKTPSGGEPCHTLPDPQDPCCPLTLCGGVVGDVARTPDLLDGEHEDPASHVQPGEHDNATDTGHVHAEHDGHVLLNEAFRKGLVHVDDQHDGHDHVHGEHDDLGHVHGEHDDLGHVHGEHDGDVHNAPEVASLGVTEHDMAKDNMTEHDVTTEFVLREHDSTGRHLSEHDMAEHDMAENDMMEHDMAEHDMMEHDMAEHEHDVTKHDRSENDMVKHDVIEHEPTKHDIAEHDRHENEMTKLDVAEHKHDMTKHDKSEHDMTENEMVKHDVTEHDMTEHDVTEHGVAEHDMTEHGVAEHDMTEHGVAEHDMTDHATAEHEPGHVNMTDRSPEGARLLPPAGEAALPPGGGCVHKGEPRALGEEFFDTCSHYCLCGEGGEVHCAPIDCPDAAGLDLADAACLEWGVDPAFVASPPSCCPRLVCTHSSDCQYLGHHFSNFETLPSDVTGCAETCVCQYGAVTCRDACEDVSDDASALPCDAADAVRVTLPGDKCCLGWQCGTAQHGLEGVLTSPHPHFPPHPQLPPSLPPHPEAGLGTPTVTSQTPDSAHVSFSLPSSYRGLPGVLFVRYTADPSLPPAEWDTSPVAPPDTLLSSSEWGVDLPHLVAGVTYTLQVALVVARTNTEVTSPLVTFTTQAPAPPPAPTTVDAGITATEVGATSALISWRPPPPDAAPHVDGVQLKFRAAHRKLPQFSPMLHSSTTQFPLQHLSPNTTYSVDLFYLPHLPHDPSVTNSHPLSFTTLSAPPDPYNFTLHVDAGEVTPRGAVVHYGGVPAPEEKYVSVYQLVYLREADRLHGHLYRSPADRLLYGEDVNEAEGPVGSAEQGPADPHQFRVRGLAPNQTYQLWLVAYLSNGRTLKSNVLDVRTPPADPATAPDPLARAEAEAPPASPYYASMVAASVVASIACLACLACLLLLLRRHAASASIQGREVKTTSVASAAYDNPSYKTYDLEMNGLKGPGEGGGGGAADGP